MQKWIGFLSGGLFGAGLFVSGMTDTTKVQGWLDVFGDWDPTLAFVMGGAILPMAIAWQISRRMGHPYAGQAFPAASGQVDRKLIIGSVLFGIGWGLVGLCPGPAVASISYGGMGGAVFLIAMLIGMRVAPLVRSGLDRFVAAE
jgi:uncharacterized protein